MAKNKIGSKAKYAAKDAKKAVVKAKRSAVSSANKAINSLTEVNITPEEIICQAAKLPIAKVNRRAFLKKELSNHYSEEMVKLAIEHNPAYAGIDKYAINKIANQVIQYETNKVASISFATGIPGGIAGAAAIPVDVYQYFAFILRTMQEIAYLYGFDEFDFNNESISSDTMNKIMIFLGVMYGVQSANSGVKIVAQSATKNVAKTLANKPLTKTAIYPIVKKVAKALGFKMTKQIFADGVSKVVPVIGGAVAGGLTYATFKPNCIRLKHSFWNLHLCDVDFYEKIRSGEIKEIPEDEVIDINEEDIITEVNADVPENDETE